MLSRMTTLYPVSSGGAKPKTCRRNLFGPVDHDQVKRDLEIKLTEMHELENKKWNFDFTKESPLPGKFAWQRVEQSSTDVHPSYMLRSFPFLSGKVDIRRDAAEETRSTDTLVTPARDVGTPATPSASDESDVTPEHSEPSSTSGNVREVRKASSTVSDKSSSPPSSQSKVTGYYKKVKRTRADSNEDARQQKRHRP
ncbi:PREDICTED: cyclin-dependent kinase inhibitor 1B-like [Priapulus caudatus]|uniref:Cyclin-dependent kinase inhibitor 1B-like n=1 Tax=Priapulus caudatus TaxID=37621 RepID=A0ABM1FB90_PRICU|nr:PREDICTED: cyclin-dependent kinase inhibitor 1B-like [Priapulus caudatus]